MINKHSVEPKYIQLPSGSLLRIKLPNFAITFCNCFLGMGFSILTCDTINNNR